MKLMITLITSTLLLAACNQGPTATDTPTSTPTADAVSMSPADHEAMAPDVGAASSGTAASATGTVESIDIANGKVTIAHGPVPELQWPAMTMAFTATPEQLQSIQTGQQVEFQFVAQGMKAALVSIHGR